MRLPIQSMQAVLIRPQGQDAGWYRSVVVDFEPDQELVIVTPTRRDEVGGKQEEAAEEEAAPPSPADATEAVQPASEADAESGESVEPASDAEGEPGKSDATVEEGEEEQDLVDDRSHLFGRGTKLDVEISFPDGIRSFSSVVRREDLRFGGSLRIEWPREGTRIQRRDYVRVDVAYPTTVRYEEAGEPVIRKLTGTTMDFSAGGVRLKLAEPLPAETRIDIDLEAGPLKAQSLQGRVVRSGEIVPKRRYKSRSARGKGKAPEYWVAVEFVGVGEALRKEMTQLVFEIQREQMRKSLA